MEDSADNSGRGLLPMQFSQERMEKNREKQSEKERCEISPNALRHPLYVMNNFPPLHLEYY